MNMDPVLHKAAANYLQTLQLSAYRGRRIDPPSPQPKPMEQQFAESREDLQDGGPVDQMLTEVEAQHPDKGGDPALRARILSDMRTALEQFVNGTDITTMEAAHAAAPSPYIEPRHAAILQRMKRRVELLGRPTPDLAGRLADVAGHVLLSTLPTGELNAVTVRTRDLPVYLILFDPIFFDVIDCFSEFFARAINGEAALKAAYEYGQSGREIDLTQVMRGDDRLVVFNCFRTLKTFFFEGVPPQRYVPRREKSKPFANFLCEGAGFFVTAHEYAHVLLRHPDPEGEQANQSRVQKEFAADQIACGIVMAYGEKVRSYRDMRYMGAHFFLASVMLIEAMRRSLETRERCRIADMMHRAPRPEDTHPATGLRLGVVNHWLEERYPAALYRGTQYYAALFIELAERLLTCVQPALLSQSRAGQKLVAGWYETRPQIERPKQG